MLPWQIDARTPPEFTPLELAALDRELDQRARLTAIQAAPAAPPGGGGARRGPPRTIAEYQADLQDA